MTALLAINDHKRTKDELFFSRMHYVEVTQWADVLGAAVYVTWKKLITRVDRSPDAVAKYGNTNTIPFSLARLAQHLNLTEKTLYKYIRTLWNYGLVDFVEWGACRKLGKKPLNIVVYNYPQNKAETATKPLTKLRDYDAQYKAGTYPTYLEGEGAAIYAIQDVKKAPAAVEDDKELTIDKFYALYGTPDEQEAPEALTVLNMYERTVSNMYGATGSNMYGDPYNNITNTQFNNANANINNDNASINNSFISSSSLDKSINEVIGNLEEEDENNTHASMTKMSVMQEFLTMALEARNVSKKHIAETLREIEARNVVEFDLALVNEQLDRIADKNNTSDPVKCFGVYFVNGYIDLLDMGEFNASNSQEARSNRLLDMYIPLEPNKSTSGMFYNWLDEREIAVI